MAPGHVSVLQAASPSAARWVLVCARHRDHPALAAAARGPNGLSRPDGGSAYDRLPELGVDLAKLAFEWVSSATLALNALPETDDEESRSVEVTLRWPNALSFDGAGLEIVTRSGPGWSRGRSCPRISTRRDRCGWLLSRWVNGLLVSATPVLRSALARESDPLLRLLESLGVLRRRGIADELGCTVCADDPHRCRVQRTATRRYRYRCLVNGWIEIAEEDLILIAFDRNGAAHGTLEGGRLVCCKH